MIDFAILYGDSTYSIIFKKKCAKYLTDTIDINKNIFVH